MTHDNRAAIVSGKLKQEVVVQWEAERFYSGLTVPVEFPMADIIKKRLPERVKDKNRKEKPSPVPDAPTVTPEPVASNAEPVTYFKDKETYDTEIAAGTKLEFQGLSPVWKPVTADHVFTDGYFYRKNSGLTPETVGA